MTKRAEEIKAQIEREGQDSAFWSIFDPFMLVSGGHKWNKAVEKLPKGLQKIANKHGLDTNLDWDYWNSPSFFGLSFESEDAGKYFDDYSSEYLEFLNAIEAEMWKIVEKDEDFPHFCAALIL